MRLLRENSEFREAVRREILTEELVALPQRFSEYATKTDRRLEVIEEDTTNIKATMDVMKADIEVMKTDIDVMKTDIGVMKTDIGDLKGTTMELTLEKDGLAHIIAEFDLRNVRMVRMAEQNRASADFNAAIYDARDSGLLSGDEYRRLLRTDMIVRGASRDGSRVVFVAVEASYSIDEDDIEKVGLSAAAIRKAFPDQEVHAALYCKNIPDRLSSQASYDGIRVVMQD